MMNAVVLILLSVTLGVVGQIILKHGMTVMGQLDLSSAGVGGIVWRMATSPFVVGGLAVYMAGAFFWLLALNRVDLSYAYPFASLSYVLIFLSSWLLFRESINPMRFLGMLVICLGVYFVSRS